MRSSVISEYHALRTSPQSSYGHRQKSLRRFRCAGVYQPIAVVTAVLSGIRRVQLEFLYSFPLTNLKSSASAIAVNDRIKKGRTFILQSAEVLNARVVRYKSCLGFPQAERLD
jgi:hypothetical protein